jgi:hypothetical protein
MVEEPPAVRSAHRRPSTECAHRTPPPGHTSPRLERQVGTWLADLADVLWPLAVASGRNGASIAPSMVKIGALPGAWYRTSRQGAFGSPGTALLGRGRRSWLAHYRRDVSGHGAVHARASSTGAWRTPSRPRIGALPDGANRTSRRECHGGRNGASRIACTDSWLSSLERGSRPSRCHRGGSRPVRVGSVERAAPVAAGPDSAPHAQ